MTRYFDTDASHAVPLHGVRRGDWEGWLAERADTERRWLEATRFRPESGRWAALPAADGEIGAVVVGLGQDRDPWGLGALPWELPEGRYRLARPDDRDAATALALGWGLGAYRFTRYRNGDRAAARLVAPAAADLGRIEALLDGIYLARDLINTPTEDMGPEELSGAAEALAARRGAAFQAIVGDALLEKDYPAIHAVGRASSRPPRLLDLRWGEESAPKLTLVGKGVCFDTGGLDLKPSSAMLKMKKDMGGAATMLGLASAIMATGLPVRLRLLVPAVENAVSGNAFRPGDVLRTRKGLTVEIGNTDAEGRLVLCDALAEADREAPALLLDCATLTGAARVALGPDLPALFTEDDALAEDLLAAGRAAADPLWRLPLHAPYRDLLKSPIADLNNVSEGPFAGAVTAALYLQSFVSERTCWAHIDTYAWNDKARPGRPAGGEALALRALYGLIAGRFGAQGGT